MGVMASLQLRRYLIYLGLIYFLWDATAANETCDSESCPNSKSDTPGIHNIFDYQRSIDWNDHIHDLTSWFKMQKKKQAVTFCTSDAKVAKNVKDSQFLHRPISDPFQCPPHGSLIVYKGAENKDHLPNGKGVLSALRQPRKLEANKPCF